MHGLCELCAQRTHWLQPENIMISRLQRRAKLSDFGLIAVLGDDDSETKTAGTIAFFAPEMIMPHHAGFSVKKADVWATGITLYFILFGTTARLHH